MKTRHKNIYSGQLKMALLVFCILVPIMFVTERCQGQSYDSLTQRILALETNQKQIQSHLYNSHIEFKTGTFLLVVGSAVNGASILWLNNHPENWGDTADTAYSMLIAGTILSSIGIAIQIDSHKYLNVHKKRRPVKMP